MKKIMLVIPVLFLTILAGAQQLQTSIKVVGGKARISVRATGGTIPAGFATNAVFVVAIPAANAAVSLNTPTILDPTRMPSVLQTFHNYTDASFKYYLLFYNGSSTSAVSYVDGTEYDLVELTWGGPNQSFKVSLMSLPDGNPAAPTDPSFWQQYFEIGGVGVSDPPNTWFYASATSVVVSQAVDFSTGTAEVRTISTISSVLPVHFLNFSGYKSGAMNKLLWTTASEENNRGFEVQRSLDGVNYSAIGFVNTQAGGGNSATSLSYTFDDNSPVGKRQYYRLSQQDFDGNKKLSNIVMIKGDLAATLGIGGLFPNPASTLVNVMIDAPAKDKITLQVTDMAGKIVHQQLVYVDKGSNTIPVEVAKLASGTYLVKLICQSSDCETAAAKFNKQ